MEIEDIGPLLARSRAVEAGERLHGLKPGELAIHIHGAEFGLVEAGLVFLGDDQDLVLVGYGVPSGLIRRTAREFGLGKSVDGRLSPGLAVHLQLAGESHKRLHVGVALFGDVVPHAEIVFQGCFAAGCDHHRLGLAVHLGHDMAAEVLDDHLDLLADCGRVQWAKRATLRCAFLVLKLGIVFDDLLKLDNRLCRSCSFGARRG